LGLASKDQDPRFRAFDLRGTCYLESRGSFPYMVAGAPHTGLYIRDQLERLVKEKSPAVQREALLAMRDFDAATVRQAILSLAKQYDGKDRFYLEAIGIAVGHHDQKR